MLKWSFFLLLMCLISTPLEAMDESEKKLPSITYTLKPIIDEKNCFLSVTLMFNSAERERTAIAFPSTWNGVNFEPQIKNIVFKDAQIIDHRPNNLKMISHTPNSCISVSYEIHQQEGDPSNINSAIIRRDLIHTPGYGLGAAPIIGVGEDKKSLKDPINVTLRWELPLNWWAITTYGKGAEQNFTKTLEQLGLSLYVAGTHRFYEKILDEQPVYFSLQGNLGSDDAELIKDVMSIISTQRSFFKDDDFPYYLISLIEGNDPRNKGRNFHNNTLACNFYPQASLRDSRLLLAHEYFHNWTGGKINNQTLKELIYWWDEGFTDYYCRLLELRAGRLKVYGFIDELNEILAQYYLSPARNEFNSKIKECFWKDPDVHLLPYRRGFIFALYLNDLIKSKTQNKHSLDDVMQNLFQHSKTVNVEESFSPELFNKLVSAYVPEGIQSQLNDFIEAGKTVDLSSLQANLPMEYVIINKHIVGYTLDCSEKVITIDENSDAYAKGLRKGDMITSKKIDSSQLLISVTLKDREEISFAFRKGEPTQIPQLRKDPSEFEKILTWFEAITSS